MLACQTIRIGGKLHQLEFGGLLGDEDEVFSFVSLLV